MPQILKGKNIMKKTLVVLLVLSLILCFTGCAGNTKNEEYGSNSNDSYDYSGNSSGIMGFSGTINKKWNDVKKDYTELETTAKEEIDESGKVTREEIEKLVTEIESGVDELKNGITDSNEDTARRVYKNAHKLELLAERGENDATKELKGLAKNTKALVKQYYGEADDDYNTVSEAVTSGLSKIRNFSDDIWNAFIDLFK